MGLLAGAGAGAARLAPRGAASDMNRLQSKVQTVAMPPRDKCAASDEDCFSVGCCNVAGLNCFETKLGKGKCLKNCTPSASQLCIQTQPIMDPILKDAEWYEPSMYCFAVVMQDYGSTKKMYDQAALHLAQRHARKSSGPPPSRPLTWSRIFFRAALTPPPHIKMVVSRDDCEAVQRCFITDLLLPARFSACQSLQSATSRIQGHSDALSLCFSPFSACESAIIVCVPLLWSSKLLFHTGLLCGALSFVDLPDWHGCSEARQ